ncbi:LOW QUALITY PROTEIN: hypothetical protein Cgig2_018363 [Carnegiea gigantea]|uniref:Uncharacterized protein n=1 Tax=Carnegiea gigantea TaxID=171969 RepID=A0A9Q1JQC6_9CARY|nr:LOW QUALITY PROTEIN: hypothetical protein Cgig2_018363 [Carnegiea gigantea]
MSTEFQVVSGRKQISFFIIGQAHCFGQIVEELDRDGNEDGNGDRNGQGSEHPRDDEDNLWDDIMASIEKIKAVGQLRNKCNSFPSLEIVLHINKGKSTDSISNRTPPAVQTDRVTKTATRVDKRKGIMIRKDDFSSDYEEDDDIKDGSMNDKDGSNCSVVDEDGLFEHTNEDEIR